MTMLIQDLCAAGELPVRAATVCSNAKLETVEDVKRYFEWHGTFKSIRDCGEKTEKELIGFCRSMSLTNPDSTSNSVENVAAVIYPFVTPRKERVFELFVQSQLSTLSVRA